jgi:hypothetical protein
MTKKWNGIRVEKKNGIADVWEQARDILRDSEKPNMPMRDFLDTRADEEEP